MLYVNRFNSKERKYGVLDNKTGVETYYTPEDLSVFSENNRVRGVENGQITVVGQEMLEDRFRRYALAYGRSIDFDGLVCNNDDGDWVVDLGKLNRNKQVEIPEGVDILTGRGKHIQAIKLPKTLKLLDDMCFKSGDMVFVHLNGDIDTISNSCFEECINLLEVTGGFISKVMDDSFAYCRSLQRIDLSKAEILSDTAFLSCSRLEEVDLSSAWYIGVEAFMNCDRLKRITFGVDLEGLRRECFKYNYSLESVDLSMCEKLEVIDIGVFNSCTELKSVKLPKNLRKLDERCFYGCISLEEIVLPDELEVIGKQCFSRSAIKHIEIPASVTILDYWGLSNCSDLKTIKLNEGLVGVGFNCFTGSALEEIEFPSTVVEIGRDCFVNCKNLKKIIFPANLKSYEVGSFKGCNNLEVLDMSRVKNKGLVEEVKRELAVRRLDNLVIC